MFTNDFVGKPSNRLTAERNKMKKKLKEDFLTINEAGDR